MRGMAFGFLRNPYILAGAGAMALLGATIYQYGKNESLKTGFHHRDPDPTLRVVEKDVLIAKYMTENARKVKCRAEMDAYSACIRATPQYSFARFMTWRTCKKQGDELLECTNSYFIDPKFYEENKALYLRDKALYQATNVTKKQRQFLKDVIMHPEADTQMPELKEDSKKYLVALKEHYATTGNIDSYDDYVAEKYRAENANPPPVKQYSKYGI